MRKHWIYFTETQYAHVREEAHRRHLTISALVRDIVETAVGLPHAAVRQGKRYHDERTDDATTTAPG